MRLLHTEDLHFEEFFDSDIPKYAILSHRWGEKEVSFQQMSKGKAPEGPGLTKIKDFCRLAAKDQYQWVWIDTCCIDKKSSAELSEAINSMFRWYKNAKECYVYLSDVCWWGTCLPLEQNFAGSQWFTRGWTLQELLAPSAISFYDQDWAFIGARSDLLDEITKATNIRKDCLTSTSTAMGACAAEKLSWLSHRKTSRIEDISYCMLGLFNINMPLLYGEGERAFTRLQHEILRKSADESIFVFDMLDGFDAWGPSPSVLARSPTQFHNSGDVRRLVDIVGFWEPFTEAPSDRPPYSITNKGLKFRIPPHISATLDQGVVEVPLACCRQLKGGTIESCSLNVQRTLENMWWKSYDDPNKSYKNPDPKNYSLSEQVKWPAIYLQIDDPFDLGKLKAPRGIYFPIK